MNTNVLAKLALIVCLTIGMGLSEAKTYAADFLMVIDSSGSMKEKTLDGQTKIKAAKQALLELKGDFASHQVGMMIFGHRTDPKAVGCCEDIQEVLPIGPYSESSYDAVVSSLSPRGSTPLAASLDQAKNLVLARDKRNSKVIIVVTDGNETCGGNPVEAARQIQSLGINVTIHVVGFGVKTEEVQQLTYIANAGGGVFERANEMRDIPKIIRGYIEREEEKAKRKAPAKLSPIHLALIKQLTDEDPYVRARAAETLRKLKVLLATPHVVKRVGDDTYNSARDGFAKNAALTFLEELAPESVIDALLSATRSKNDSVRYWAVVKLTTKGGPVASDGLSSVDEELVKRLTDDYPYTRQKAAEALRQRKVNLAAQALVNRVKDDIYNSARDGFAKTAALVALKELAPGKVEIALLGAMESKNSSVRGWATRQLIPQE